MFLGLLEELAEDITLLLQNTRFHLKSNKLIIYVESLITAIETKKERLKLPPTLLSERLSLLAESDTCLSCENRQIG